MKKEQFFKDVWAKTLWSTTLLALAVIYLFVASPYESSKLIQVASGVALVAFWIGALWARVWTIREMQWKLSRPLHLIDKNGNLHPFMKVGNYYGVVSYTNPWDVSGDRLYVLRDLQTDADHVIFCVFTDRDFVLPTTTFQVVKKTEERGARMRTTKFVFE